MQIAILDYETSTVSVITLPKDIEELVKDQTSDFDLNEYVEHLPGYSITQCYWMSADNIKVKVGEPKDFPEYYSFE